jgi:hypothetical protein
MNENASFAAEGDNVINSTFIGIAGLDEDLVARADSRHHTRPLGAEPGTSEATKNFFK